MDVNRALAYVGAFVPHKSNIGRSNKVLDGLKSDDLSYNNVNVCRKPSLHRLNVWSTSPQLPFSLEEPNSPSFEGMH